MKRYILFSLVLLWPAMLYGAIQSFGIFSPVMGMQESMPSITMEEAFTHDNENVEMRYGEIWRCKMRADQFRDGSKHSIQTPDTFPVLKYYYFELSNNTDHLLAFTKAHVYHWDSITPEWDLVFTCSSNATAWSVVAYNDVLYATNNIDKIQHWNGSWSTFRNLEDVLYATGTVTMAADATVEGSGTDWATAGISANDIFYVSGDDKSWTVSSLTDLNTLELTATYDGTPGAGQSYAIYHNVGIDIGATYLTKAKFLTSFEGYLMAWNVTVGGSAYPQTGYWCDTQNGNSWDTGNAGDVTLPGPYALTGCGQIADFLLVFSGRSIDQIWATDSSLIFNARRLRGQIGSYSPESIVNGPNGELFFLDNRKNMRVIQSVMSDMQIVSRAVDPTFKNIADTYISTIKSYWADSLEQMWWAVPYGTDATANNKVLCLDVNGAWTRRDMAVSAFGEYIEKTNYTINTIPFDTINEIGWRTINSVEANANYRLDICGDYSGYHFNSHNSEEDNGAAYTGYAVIGSDLTGRKGVGADQYKRLAYVSPRFRNTGSGTATISIKRDFEGAWQTLGTVNLYGSGEILWDELDAAAYRARYFQVKISASNPFRFIGMVFYYTLEGLR